MTLVDSIVKFVADETKTRAQIYRYFQRVPENTLFRVLQIAVRARKLNIHGHYNFMDDQFSRGKS